MNVRPQKRKYDPESNEYIMNKFSRIIDQKNMSFAWKPSTSQTPNVPSSVMDIVNNKPNGTIVCVKVKVISKSTPEIVYSRTMQKPLKKSELLVADSSSAIPITIWKTK